MTTQPDSIRHPLSVSARSDTRPAVALLAMMLLLPAASVWAHPGGGGGSGGHASAGGGGHAGGGHPAGGSHLGGGAHFSGSSRFSSAPRFAIPEGRVGGPGASAQFNRAPAFAATSRGAVQPHGWISITPRTSSASGASYDSARGALTARGGIAPHGGAIEPGRFGGHPWNGGYWRGRYWPPVYYGGGFAWFMPVLPPYCLTFWWGGVPYYYYNDAYYTWNPNDGGYIATEPPPVANDAVADAGTPAYTDVPDSDSGYGASATYAPVSPDAAAQNPNVDLNAAPTVDPGVVPTNPPANLGGNLYAYPKNGQSPEQQAADRRECAQWAAAQSPETANGSSLDYKRALSACLTGRGYSVD